MKAFTLIIFFIFASMYAQAQTSYIPTADEHFAIMPSNTQGADALFLQQMQEQRNSLNLNNALVEITNLQNQIDALDRDLNLATSQGLIAAMQTREQNPMAALQEQSNILNQQLRTMDQQLGFSSNISLLQPAPQLLFDFQLPGYVDPVTRGNRMFDEMLR